MNAPTLTPGQLLAELQRRGMHLATDGPGRLVFVDMPHPVLDDELVTSLNAYRPALLDLMRELGRDRLPPITAALYAEAV
jgi:hypothetical protein